MNTRITRILTALAIIGICIWPVWQGYEVIRFALAGTSPDVVGPWIDMPGVAFDAREDALTAIDDSSDDQAIRKRRDEIEQILAIRPLSSSYWLKLAEARIDDNEPLAKALEDLEMSTVTGPNEEAMITQRGLFGVWQWEVLPPEVRQRAIADLVAVRPTDPKAAWLKSTLAGKSEEVREEIRSALLAQGFSQSNFDRIGL